jgi:hypothetical protein
MVGHSAEPTGAATPDDSNNSGSYQDSATSRPQSDSGVNPALNTALRLAELGYVVGQTYPKSKRPMGGDTRSTTDPGTLTEWWRVQPDAGLFVNLERSGLIDVSSDNSGKLADFQQRGLTPTLSFESGSGAGHEHHLYRLPACRSEGLSAGAVTRASSTS